jgi:alanine racemase
MTDPRSIATVDLGAIAHNAARLLQALDGAELIAVVKAGGYGHGALPVAQAAIEAGATRLGVAALSEAAELRAGKMTAPIIVMGPIGGRDDIAAARDLGVELVVWTQDACVAASAAHVPVHLKLDTGMGRLGARAEDVEGLASAAENARVVGLMTHLATADEREGDNASFMTEQLVRFRGLCTSLRSRFPDAIVHAANSAACLRDSAAVFDAARCGIALYGCSPYHGSPDDDDLQPALRWSSQLASVKTVRSQESVGYGRAHRAARGTRIGLVPVGYADGASRSLGNTGSLLVGGRRVPIVGNISMDQLTVDLGPESADRVGDEVVLVGRQGGERITVEEVATWRGTINYEVTCGIGSRVVRAWTH